MKKSDGGDYSDLSNIDSGLLGRTFGSKGRYSTNTQRDYENVKQQLEHPDHTTGSIRQ